MFELLRDYAPKNQFEKELRKNLLKVCKDAQNNELKALREELSVVAIQGLFGEDLRGELLEKIKKLEEWYS